MFVALGIQHAMRMRHIVAYTSLRSFSTLSHQRHDFREKVVEHNMCFDVLLAVHYSNDQFWFQLMHHNFTLLTKSLYMFRAPTCPSSGGQAIYIHHNWFNVISYDDCTVGRYVKDLHKLTNRTVVISDDIEPVVVYI